MKPSLAPLGSASRPLGLARPTFTLDEMKRIVLATLLVFLACKAEHAMTVSPGGRGLALKVEDDPSLCLL